jgi:hypothetical protein
LHFTPVDQNTHRRDAEGAEILENPQRPLRLGGEKLLGGGSRPQKRKDRGMGKARVYEFNQKRHDKYYSQKRVEVIYTVDKGTIEPA